MPYGPPLYGIIFGAYFLQIWGVGVVRSVFTLESEEENRPKIKKVHPNEFFCTITVWVLGSCYRGNKANVCTIFLKKKKSSGKCSVFGSISGFWVGFWASMEHCQSLLYLSSPRSRQLLL